MPAKATKAKKSSPAPAEAQPPAQPAAPTRAKASKAVRSEPAPAAPAPADSGEAAEAEEFVPMNRAERRAKGRGKSIASAPTGRGKVTGSHGPAHTQRNWANRRTG